MRQFVTTVVGGITIIFLAIGIYGVLEFTFPDVFDISKQSRGAVSQDQTTPKNSYVYTAMEEEDLVNATLEALPPGAGGKISAKAYLVKNLNTEEILFEHSSTRLLPIASLTKLVTAVVARRSIPGDTLMEIDTDIMRTYGNAAGFLPREIFTADDLLYPLLMVSSNDAAETFARKYGSRKDFVRAMNDFAQSIGAYRTYFRDPSGLSPANASSVVDQTIILEWIRKNDPEILVITSAKSKTIRSHTWVNPTHFLSWSYYVGGKNGFTDEAGRTSASLFRLGPKKDVYGIVLLGSENRDADAIQLIRMIESIGK